MHSKTAETQFSHRSCVTGIGLYMIGRIMTVIRRKVCQSDASGRKYELIQKQITASVEQKNVTFLENLIL